MSDENARVKQKEVGGSADQFWNPRFWDGMTMSAWTRAAWSGRFRVTPSRVCMFGIISGLSVINSSLTVMENLFNSRKIRRTQLVGDPVFVIGHWRSGTTLLHEYLIRDEQFTFSDTYTCFAPTHFNFSGPLFRPWVQWLMPAKRPMDNMAVGLDRPQEDEFALCAAGLPSPYLSVLYPNLPPIDLPYLTLRDISDKQRKQWLDTFEWFLKSLTFANNKRIVLKSPPHTGRIRTILERFPNAKFVHINRNPYTLFPSTYTLWMKLAGVHGLQHPKGKGLEEKIYHDFELMYEAYEADQALLQPGQLIDVGYDELVAAPVEVLRKIYETLDLGDFASVEGRFAEYASTQKSYKKNKFGIDPEIAETISRRWSGYIQKYGYELPK